MFWGTGGTGGFGTSFGKKVFLNSPEKKEIDFLLFIPPNPPVPPVPTNPSHFLTKSQKTTLPLPPVNIK